MDDIIKYLQNAVDQNASDVFIIPGSPISMKIDGQIVHGTGNTVTPEIANFLVKKIYKLADRSMDQYIELGDDDFSLSIMGLSRFRISTYRQRGSMAAVIRVITFEIPDPDKYSIPKEIIKIGEKSHGMVLLTGPAGGGKSTTMACIANKINSYRNGHIITIEDPIEFLHKNNKCVISQREIGTDTTSYVVALRACLRQAPDVIMLGEMRDLETIKIAMTAAETGHLLFSTLHTIGSVNTIDRIIDVFPPNQQIQIRAQLSMVLKTVISQQLVPSLSGPLIPVFEIMHLNNAIRTMIREANTHQIDAIIQSSSAENMISMDTSLLNLYKQGKISAETAQKYAMNQSQMERRL